MSFRQYHYQVEYSAGVAEQRNPYAPLWEYSFYVTNMQPALEIGSARGATLCNELYVFTNAYDYRGEFLAGRARDIAPSRIVYSGLPQHLSASTQFRNGMAISYAGPALVTEHHVTFSGVSFGSSPR